MEDLRGSRVPVPIVGDRGRRGTSEADSGRRVYLPYARSMQMCRIYDGVYCSDLPLRTRRHARVALVQIVVIQYTLVEREMQYNTKLQESNTSILI